MIITFFLVLTPLTAPIELPDPSATGVTAPTSGPVQSLAAPLDPAQDPFNAAVRASDLAGIRTRLREGLNPNLLGSDGVAPLHIAVEGGKGALAQTLVRGGADVSMPNQGGDTPLHIAGRKGFTSVFRYLIDAGANPRAVNSSGISVLRAALESGKPEIVKLVVNAGAEVEPGDVRYAAAKSKPPCLSVLAARGANLGERDEAGYAPIHWAAREERLDMLQALVQHKIHVDTVGPSGASPLMTAILAGKLKAAHLLLSLGADVNFRSIDRVTPLFMAAVASDLSYFEELLKRGANPSLLNNEGDTAVEWAIMNGPKWVKSFKRLKLPMEIKNGIGKSREAYRALGCGLGNQALCLAPQP